MMDGRRPAFLTVDLEDYRSIRMRDYGCPPEPMKPAELEREIDILLELFDSMQVAATFFSVGRLATDLPPSVWARIVGRHPIGGHSFDHQRVRELGADGFESDLRRTRAALEDVSGEAVVSYRAPYFSSHGCGAWYGERLAKAGFLIDSSLRLGSPPRGFRGSMALEGSAGAVMEIPLLAPGMGGTRLCIIGGTYFRLLPLPVIRRLMGYVESRGFAPMVYLHPYDVDPHAPPLELPGSSWTAQCGDRMRRAGRASAAAKLRALADTYRFAPVESVLPS